jgi:hypothetical protein
VLLRGVLLVEVEESKRERGRVREEGSGRARVDGLGKRE